MPYNCTICNKEFISNSGFWKHNKKYHQSILINDNSILTNNNSILTNNNSFSTKISSFITHNNNNKLQCKFCNKLLSRIDNVTRHEKQCQNKNNEINELQMLKNEIEILKLTLQKTLQIKTKKNIFNNNNNNSNNNNTINNNNNTINIVKFGTEDLQNIFTEKQMFNLINKGGACINESIKYIHFNDKKPEYVQIKIL
jgi:phage FluMu protein Com